MTNLSAQNILFFSQGDETNFFQLLEKISAVESVRGHGLNIIIEIKPEIISAENFLTLYAVFKRYNADCRQLSNISMQLDSEGRQYVMSEEMIWYRDIFE